MWKKDAAGEAMPLFRARIPDDDHGAPMDTAVRVQ